MHDGREDAAVIGEDASACSVSPKEEDSGDDVEHPGGHVNAAVADNSESAK